VYLLCYKKKAILFNNFNKKIKEKRIRINKSFDEDQLRIKLRNARKLLTPKKSFSSILESINDNKIKLPVNESLYKLNIQNNSAWQKMTETNIFYDQKHLEFIMSITDQNQETINEIFPKDRKLKNCCKELRRKSQEIKEEKSKQAI